jgi:hypothetical protein
MIVRQLQRGTTYLLPGGGERRCRTCGAAVYYARNNARYDDWIKFDDPAYMTEHRCWSSVISRDIQGMTDLSQVSQVVQRTIDAVQDWQIRSGLASGTAKRDDPVPLIAPAPRKPTIAMLLQQAARGAFVDLTEPAYREHVHVSASVTLRSRSGTTIEATDTKPVLTVSGGDVEFVGLTISSEFGDGVVVEDARVTLRDCTIDVADTAVYAVGATSRVRIMDSYVVSSAGAAVYLGEGTTGIINGSLIQSTAGDGVYGEHGVTLEIADSSVSECGESGIDLEGSSVLYMDSKRSVTIARNRQDGIRIANGGSVLISGGEIIGNGRFGISLDSSTLEIDQCSVEQNRAGRFSCEGVCLIK